jgi:glutamine amidotransferase-like uncharacterized protein
MIGPDSYPYLKLNADNLEKADCLVMPGGLGDSDQFDQKLYRKKKIVQNYVASGGRYLGICMGGYFAGHHYFDILTNVEAVQYIKRKGSSTKKSTPVVIDLTWGNNNNCPMYFFDGAAFIPKNCDHMPAKIISRYQNGDVAALMQPFGRGIVGVIGPHPEAQKWWFYTNEHIKHRWKDSVQDKLFLNFVKKLIK